VKRRRRGSRAADVAWALLAAFVGIQAYALLHEVGHALAVRSVGGTVAGIEPWWFAGPRVRLVGEVAGASGAWVALAGTLLPWLLGVVALAWLRPRGPVARWSLLMLGTGLLASLLPWVAAPVWGERLPGDDVAHFLQRSDAPPALVTGVALAAGALLAAAAVRALGGPRAALASLTGLAGVGRRPAAWALLVAAGLAVAAASWAVGRVAVPSSEAAGPPAGFRLAADLRLSGGLLTEQLAGDVAPAAHRLEVWVEARDVVGHLRVELVDPEGGRTTILAVAPGLALELGRARAPAVAFGAGRWSVQASAAPSAGRLLVGWRSVPSP